MDEVARMRPRGPETNPVDGTVVFAPVKSIWFLFMLGAGVIGGVLTFTWSAVLVSLGLTTLTLCLGHTIGLHRMLIHRSFECPKWFEYLLAHLGTLVGMGGPFAMLYLHDIRDWAQRHPVCHRLFIHQNPSWKDFLWRMFGTIKLEHPPEFRIEPEVADDWVYRCIQR